MSCLAAANSCPALFAVDTSSEADDWSVDIWIHLTPGLGSGRKQRAPEDGCRAPGRLLAIEQRNQRRPPCVVTGVPSRTGDATAEDQRASGVIQERLSGRHGPEMFRLAAIVIAHDGDIRQRGRRAPQ